MKHNDPLSSDLEVVKNNYTDRNYVIKISIPEFSCVCPKTSLPDYGTIKINYIPNDYIVELKSLKLYIVKFRSVGVFHEHVTNQILDDFKNAAHPRKIEVIGLFNPRGGIQTSIESCWEE